jgi:hypothetical protein
LLRTSFTPIPSSQEVVADKEVIFDEALDKYAFSLPGR